MPIHAELMLNSVSDSDFAAIDEAVIRAAYATQNKFGRLFDERVYENDLACRLRAEGYDVHTQVPVRVAHGSFEKTYFLDLVVNHMLYEVKAVSVLLDEHKAQALNYAMLQDIRRVKLLNFGEPKVRGQLLLNAVSGEERYQPRLRKAGWRVITPQCEVLLSYGGAHCGGLALELYENSPVPLITVEWWVNRLHLRSPESCSNLLTLFWPYSPVGPLRWRRSR